MPTMLCNAQNPIDDLDRLMPFYANVCAKVYNVHKN